MIIANFKSNVVNFDRWAEDFINSCPPVMFNVGVALPSIYITQYSLGIEHWPDEDNLENDFSRMAIGAQDVDHSSGSRTGAISTEMLDEVGVEFVIIGHSERREFFHEDNGLIRKKIQAVNESKIGSIILCIGETKEENKMGATKDVLKNQLSVINGFELGKNFTIAYEPVWAIGTGLVASKQYIEDVLSYINNLIKELYSVEDRPNIRLFYGGSVDENSVEELSSIALLDGFLIGSASADFEKFKNMLNKMR